jgi:hypothetical protein
MTAWCKSAGQLTKDDAQQLIAKHGLDPQVAELAADLRAGRDDEPIAEDRGLKIIEVDPGD